MTTKIWFRLQLSSNFRAEIIAHEILKFVRNFLEANRMQCKALKHATSNVVGGRGLLRGKGATS
ncbi:hypothetical protein [Campylobacter concisus]